MISKKSHLELAKLDAKKDYEDTLAAIDASKAEIDAAEGFTARLKGMGLVATLVVDAHPSHCICKINAGGTEKQFTDACLTLGAQGWDFKFTDAMEYEGRILPSFYLVGRDAIAFLIYTNYLEEPAHV
ncbi:hypothetical protein [Andreprevotia chitinilytica]|uniref:hypothetical protein n=1 Tax=Andreprevotia chitinilytica TaxID=396808 RepID=UPI00054D1168|nr:hypothetical protein [Andreprevotia chitinilytica]